MVMKRTFHRIGFTAQQSAELWERWKKGEGLKAIGRVFGKPSSRSERRDKAAPSSTISVGAVIGGARRDFPWPCGGPVGAVDGDRVGAIAIGR